MTSNRMVNSTKQPNAPPISPEYTPSRTWSSETDFFRTRLPFETGHGISNNYDQLSPPPPPPLPQRNPYLPQTNFPKKEKSKAKTRAKETKKKETYTNIINNPVSSHSLPQLLERTRRKNSLRSDNDNTFESSLKPRGILQLMTILIIISSVSTNRREEMRE